MTDPRTEAEESLADLVRKLTSAVEVLSERFRRKRVSDAVLAVVVAFIIGFIAYYVLIIRPSGRAQIHNLACYAVRLSPPGQSATTDDLRARYNCPPYDPTITQHSGQPGSTASPSSTTRPSSTTGALPAPSTAAQSPRATRSSARLPNTPSARPRATKTPAPARTVIHRRSVAATPTETAQPSGLVNRVLCPIANLPLICTSETP